MRKSVQRSACRPGCIGSEPAKLLKHSAVHSDPIVLSTPEQVFGRDLGAAVCKVNSEVNTSAVRKGT